MINEYQVNILIRTSMQNTVSDKVVLEGISAASDILAKHTSQQIEADIKVFKDAVLAKLAEISQALAELQTAQVAQHNETVAAIKKIVEEDTILRAQDMASFRAAVLGDQKAPAKAPAKKTSPAPKVSLEDISAVADPLMRSTIFSPGSDVRSEPIGTIMPVISSTTRGKATPKPKPAPKGKAKAPALIKPEAPSKFLTSKGQSQADFIVSSFFNDEQKSKYEAFVSDKKNATKNFWALKRGVQDVFLSDKTTEGYLRFLDYLQKLADDANTAIQKEEAVADESLTVQPDSFEEELFGQA